VTCAPWVMAYRTDFPVNADSCTAMSAGPAFIFPAQKLVNTFLFNVFQVLQHAHVVLCSVPFIQLFEPFARIFFTSGTIFRTGIDEQFTICNDAFFAVFRFIRAIFTAPWGGFLIPKICIAYSAIHAAGDNQVWL